jgi:hypothetical protein
MESLFINLDIDAIKNIITKFAEVNLYYTIIWTPHHCD